MKTYTIIKNDELLGFEIDHLFVSAGFIAKYLSTKDGVSNIQRKNLDSSDNRLEFEFRGSPYVISEDYGDSSRYWIGPKDANTPLLQTAELEAHFKDLRESLLRKILYYGILLFIAAKLVHFIYVKII